MDEAQAQQAAEAAQLLAVLTLIEHHARQAREMYCAAAHLGQQAAKPSVLIAGRIGNNGAPIDPNAQAKANAQACAMQHAGHMNALRGVAASLFPPGGQAEAA